jgi:hypothetical protein
MHRIHLRMAAPEQRVRPAKTIALEARRQARHHASAPKPRPHRPAA